MSRKNSNDYIPTGAELERQHEESIQNAKAAKDRGFRLGEYEFSYKLNGRAMHEKVSAVSKTEAMVQFKQQCDIVGWLPYDIDVKTLVEPNVFV